MTSGLRLNRAYTWSSAESKQGIFLMHSSYSTSAKPLSEPTTTSNSGLARVALAAIRFYQRVTSGRTAPCRFYPSCSEYALEAVSTHGALGGGALALRRLVKCRPLGPHGIDLVPEPRTRSSH
jgi:putative membrane protein insertion efficiency factor